MMHPSSRSSVKSTFILTASMAALCGCGSPPAPRSPAAPPPVETAIPGDAHMEWWMVHQVQLVNSQRTRKPAGYLEHWRDGKGETLRYWVRDLANRKRGFLLPQFQAFQVVESRDIFGKVVIESRSMGNIGLEGGIQRILEIPEGSIEIEKMSEHTPPPEAAKAP